MGKKRVWVRIALDQGGSYLTEPGTLGILDEYEIETAIYEEDWDAKWTLTLERLTQEEFDALPEFMGH